MRGCPHREQTLPRVREFGIPQPEHIAARDCIHAVLPDCCMIADNAHTIASSWKELVAVDATSRPIRPEWYSEEFKRLSRVAGLPAILLHDARHSAASLLASLGVPVTVASNLLGHDPVVFSRTYAHAFDADKRSAIDSLGQALSGGR